MIMAAVTVMGQSEKAIIPVNAWPKKINTTDKIICNPTADQCVKEGYRLLTTKPATPEGKRIKSEKIIQDDKDATRCQYEIVYDDIPVVIPPVIVPDVLTNIPSNKVTFNFTTSGGFRGVIWTDAPKTNGIEK